MSAKARRRETAAAALGDDQTNPDYLRMMLFGGKSKGDEGRHFPGLAERVQKRITDIYRAPRPSGHSTGSVIGGGVSGSASGEPDVDPRELADYLVDWIGDTSYKPNTRVSEAHLHGLASRANGRAGRILKKQHVTEAERRQVRDLCMRYLGWLRRACDHADATPGQGARECKDCGAVIIDIG